MSKSTPAHSTALQTQPEPLSHHHFDFEPEEDHKHEHKENHDIEAEVEAEAEANPHPAHVAIGDDVFEMIDLNDGPQRTGSSTRDLEAADPKSADRVRTRWTGMRDPAWRRAARAQRWWEEHERLARYCLCVYVLGFAVLCFRAAVGMLTMTLTPPETGDGPEWDQNGGRGDR